MKLKAGDEVIIIAGKDKGQEGKIERVYPKSNKVLIPDRNMYKKSVRKSEQMPQGGIVDLPRPLDASKVMLKDPKTGTPTRIGYTEEKGKKVRVAKKSGTVLKK